METRICRAYNLSRSCLVSSKMAVAHSELQPLKALKVLLNGLALDSESSLWLSPCPEAPKMMRLFPFDFVYLDAKLVVIEMVELLPEVPFPPFRREVSSALILPLHTCSYSGMLPGDRFLICSEEELAIRLAEIATQRDLALVATPALVGAPAPLESLSQTPAPLSRPAAPTQPNVLRRSIKHTPGTSFTVSLTTTWQITSFTTAATVIPQPGSHAPAVNDSDALSLVQTAITEKPPAPPEIATSESKDPACETAIVELSSAIPDQETGLHETASSTGLEVPTESARALAARLAALIPAPSSWSPAKAQTSHSPVRIPTACMPLDKAPVKPVPAVNPASSEPTIQDQKKDPLGTRVIRWLNLEDPPPERRSVIRLLLRGLEAYDTHGDESKRYPVRDVCPPGLFLRASETWPIGKVVSLMIEKEGATEADSQHRVSVQARVIRCDHDGIGLAFLFPDGTEYEPWQRVKTKSFDESEADFIIRELRLSTALGFLCRLCPDAASEIKHALHDRLSNSRVSWAVDIALKAEQALAGGAVAIFAHPKVVMRVIENGSWTEDEWIRRLWAGILVSSCSKDGMDTSNMVFLDLLAKLTPIHLRILTFACGKVASAAQPDQCPANSGIDCTADELIGASDSQSFARIQQTIGHLSSCGLLAENSRPSYIALTSQEKTRIIPTFLGLKMYARCNGIRA